MFYLVTTPVNRQYDGMWEIQWAVENCKVIKTRHKGLFLIEADEEALQKIKDYETTAIYRVIPLDAVVSAHLPDITKETIAIAQKKLKKGESFAVRCKRRGFSISSKEIEQKIGAQIVETFKNPVNLDNPDKVVLIEIIDKKAGISILKKDGIVKKEVIEL
ncbi:MAG: RNA-binding protein [Theionarchaea archaeon]|nr:RNA-binding protein [Theionarchaea archaeon]